MPKTKLQKIGSFHAETFEELFQGTKSLPWEDYIPKDGKFWVCLLYTSPVPLRNELIFGNVYEE